MGFALCLLEVRPPAFFPCLRFSGQEFTLVASILRKEKDFISVTHQGIVQIARRFSAFAEKSSRSLRVYLRKLIRRLKLPFYTFFVFSAVATGILAGLAAVAFHDTIELLHELFLSRSSEIIGFLGSLRIIL